MSEELIDAVEVVLRAGFSDHRQRAIQALVALGIPAATLSALRSGEMVAVPREPTEAMKKAGSRALSGWIAPAMHADDAYCAMLAAAKDARHD